jgi:HEAT repeat protein
MPKETLSLLARDAERLLFAGAQVARGDSDVEARRQKLAPFSAKVPAIGKVVEQVEKVQKAPPKGAAAELLNLAALMAQVRGAQASLFAATGELSPVPPAEPVESPLSPTELSTLVNALTVSGKARPRIISDAVERGAVRDLRLLPYCVRAIADPAVGYVVADELLPSLGMLVVPELRATLRIANGKETDARKLRVLTAIQKADAKPLLVEATEKGSPEIRRTAVTELSELDPGAVEPIALRLLAEDRSAEVKRAAASALGGATSDAALDALMTAFAGSRELRHAAGLSLARLGHPGTTERAIALLTPEMLALTSPKLPKADTPAKKKANEKIEREHREQVAFLESVLDLLASRTDKLGTADTVLSVFRNHKVKDVRNAAARALLKSGYDKVFEELAPSVYESDWDTRDGFIEGILAREKERAFDRLGRFLDPAALKNKNHVAFAEHLLETLEGHSDDAAEPVDEEPDDAPEKRALPLVQQDPRWADAAIKLLDHKELRGSALDLLGKVKSDKAREAVIAYVSAQKKMDEPWRLMHALQNHKDPRVPPLLLRILDSVSGSWARRSVLQTLRQYDDPATAPMLETWANDKKRRIDKREREQIDDLLQFLTRDRALTAGV